MAAENNEDNGDKVRNKIAIAEPNFSLSIESDEDLVSTKKVFDQLMRKYKKGEGIPKDE